MTESPTEDRFYFTRTAEAVQVGDRIDGYAVESVELAPNRSVVIRIEHGGVLRRHRDASVVVSREVAP